MVVPVVRPRGCRRWPTVDGVSGSSSLGASPSAPSPRAVAPAGGAAVLVLAYVAFISLGLPDGLLGVGWPSAAADFGVSTGALGLVTITMTAAYLLSSTSAGFVVERLGVGRLLAVSTALASAGLVGYAAAPALGFMAAAAVLAGLGAGAIDSGLNAYAAEEFGPRHMNWLHAAFGVGATVGPLVMTAVLALGLSWRWGFAVVAVAQAVLAVAFTLTAGMWTRHHEATSALAPAAVVDPIDPLGLVDRAAEPARPPARETFRLPSLWWGATAFALYTSLELSTGLWAFLLLTEGRGLSTAVAGVCVAGYWASLTVGRVLVGWVSEHIGPRRVIAASIAGLAVGAGLMALPAQAWVAVAGLAVVGLSAAPVFPMMTLTTSERVGDDHAARAIGIQIGAASVGAALIPAAIGVVLARTTPDALGLLLLALALALAAVYALAQRTSPAAGG